MFPKPKSRRGKHSTRYLGDLAEKWLCERLEAHGLPSSQIKQTCDGFPRADVLTDKILFESKVARLPKILEDHLRQADGYCDTIYQGALRTCIVLKDGNEARVYMDLEKFLELLEGR